MDGVFRRPPVFLHVFREPPKPGSPARRGPYAERGGGASERRGAPGFDQRLIEVSDLDNVNDRYENECVGD